MSAYVRITDLEYRGETVPRAVGRVRYAEGAWSIPYATAELPGATVSVSGTVSAKGELALEAHAAGVELARALEGRVKEPPTGTAYVSAAVTGTLDEPRVEGRAQVYHPRYAGQSADYAEARFAAADFRHVQLSGLNLIREPARVTSPRLVLTRGEAKDAPWEVQGDVTVQGLTVVQALRLGGFSLERLEKNPLAGRLEPVRLSLSGPARTPKVEFQAAAREVVFQGLDLGRVTAAGSADLQRGRIELASVEAVSPQGHASGSGTVAFDPKAAREKATEQASFDLQVRAGGIKLLPLVRRFSPDLLEQVRFSGTLASAEGRVRGRADAPELTARATLEDVVLNDRAVAIEPFEVSWTPAAVLARDVRAKVGSGTVLLAYAGMLLGEKRPKRLSDRVFGRAEVHGLPVAVARQLLEDSPFYGQERAREVREALAEWRTPVAGQIEATAELPAGPGAPASARELAQMAAARQGGGRLEGSVALRDLVSPPGGGGRPVQVAARFAYQSGRLEVPELRAEQANGAVLTASGTRSAPGKDGRSALDFQVRVSDFQLASLARIPIAGLRERLLMLRPLEGTVALQASITGTDKNPAAQFSGEIARPVVRGLPFDTLHVEGGAYSAQEGVLRIGAARLTKRLPGTTEDGAASVTLSGFLPLAWPQLSVPEDAQRGLRIEIPEQSLAVFNALADDAASRAASEEQAAELPTLVGLFRNIAATQGRMQGEISLAGSLRMPRDSGYFALNDATLRSPQLETEIRDFDARLDLAGDRVRVTEFHGVSQHGGEFRGGGEVLLRSTTSKQPRLNLTLALEKFKFVEKQVGRLVGESFRGTQVRGTLQTVNPVETERSEPIRIAGDWPNPTISGGVLLDDASLVVAFESLAGHQAPELPFNPNLNLRLVAGKDVWLRNPQLRLRLAGSLQATNTLAEPVVAGDIQASRGAITLATLRLRDVGGLIRVAYDGRGRDLGVPGNPPVYVDLTGSTTIRLQRSAAVETDYYDATFSIKGSPGGGGTADIRPAGVGSGLAIGSGSGLTLTVRTDPPLPSQEIEALIRQQFGAEGFAGGGANVVEAL
ncbi:MAG TPA: translocation/assembly module TamB domain-containing protein, partial [Armatimonadota bacterium]|nr:translocation/assembly module TamB domain-containing protein [Armatimonadota bacterium]